MVSFPRQRRPKPKTAGAGKRVIVVFGPPSSGVSTLVDCLSQASETQTAVVPYLGPSSISHAEEALQNAEVVLLDVDGGVFGPEDVQELVDNRLIYTGSGAVVRVYAPDEDILARAAKRPGYTSEMDLRAWDQAVGPVEERIRAHTLNYFMVPNIDLVEATKQLALRSGILR
jgi:hypothetical protein